MDCIKAREKIDNYVDDMLSQDEKDQLLLHASSCPQCQKALNDAMKLKCALGSLGEIEPPAGLAASAVKIAKKHRVPFYAYATVAAAAVVALAFALSPLMMNGGNSTAESADEKIMYSAASFDAEAEDGMIMESAPEEGVAEAPQLENSLGAGAPRASERSESAAIASGVNTFLSEDDFVDAIMEYKDSIPAAAYYRPAKLPQGAELQQIDVSDLSVRWIYLIDGNTGVFEWLRAYTTDDIRDWSEQTQLHSDQLARSFKLSGDIFWSAEARFNDMGQMEATDGTTVNAYWLQDGQGFHMELPAVLTEKDIAAYCVAEQVPIQ